jgi:uncharacterized membrane protein YkvA (DUF1232 family)
MFRLFRFWRIGRHDLRFFWFALRHRSRPAWAIPAAGALLFYAFEPLNFAVPVVGVIDDFLLLPLLLRWLTKLLPAQIHLDFNRTRQVSQ